MVEPHGSTIAMLSHFPLYKCSYVLSENTVFKSLFTSFDTYHL